jgi:fumarylacetoacetase
MPIEINATHDPWLRSWVESANGDTDFPIQNLPFGLFSVAGGPPRGGVALGDFVIDLVALAASGQLDGLALRAAEAASGDTLLPLLEQPRSTVSALRGALSRLYSAGDGQDRVALGQALVPLADCAMHLPMRPTAFTDYCTSIDHIRRMGAASGSTPSPAWLRLPVAYNGRASSVVVDGTAVVRPNGQFEAPPGSNTVKFGPEPALDFELEFGAWLSGGNALGAPVSVAEAEAQIFGCCLVNDWSARGIQFFESMLGPHLGKNFQTTVSPWIVTAEALAPFRVPARGRDADEPTIPSYLLDRADRDRGAIAVELSAELNGHRIVRTDLQALFWTMAQMVAHQASAGAPLEVGDLVASGTVSGPEDTAKACMAEITARGTAPITLPDGSRRAMLEDGDTLTLRGRAMAQGYVPIGFGACSGIIRAAVGGAA